MNTPQSGGKPTPHSVRYARQMLFIFRKYPAKQTDSVRGYADMPKKPNVTAQESAALAPDGAAVMTGGFLACGQAQVMPS